MTAEALHDTAQGPGDALLVLNAGSSSIKFSLYRATPDVQGEPVLRGQGSLEQRPGQWRLAFVDASGNAQHEQWPLPEEGAPGDSLEPLVAWIERHTGAPLAAAGHRIVHGGSRQAVAARVDGALLDELQALTPIAPLHQPLCLAPVRFLARRHPQLPQVACFDTAFHHTLDALECHYGLPRHLTDEGVRRYGFHGLSYEYIAGALPGYDAEAARGRTIVAHLGNGASLCALHKGRSRATSMGFTTLDGLLMGSRPGHLDPGILLYLLRERGLSVQALEHLLYHECGLLGVSGGISGDMRELLASDSSAAREAVALYVHNVVREIGAFSAVLGGLDAVVLTGGIGEHAAAVRAGILRGCAWLGVQLDEQANEAAGPRLSRPGSPVSAWMIPTDEDRVIARHTLKLLRGNARGQPPQ
ncbi:acetate/propionate family kinase [Pseudomonas typographi]|uniref:Acetate kinase n=1 Tax=Pseudomonas typographi TaxID=2715964 RepID=A0ABR7Z534_9PSED|nr:acetate/propionate family kinase [Pseudomonas typographi]MBD1600619.1 acetate/propionate family kinase [Pseudomonas typographi]